MKLTGIYTAHYQDIRKRWDKLVAKCGSLEKAMQELKNKFAVYYKKFDAEIAKFDGTSYYEQKTTDSSGKTVTYTTVRINGIEKSTSSNNYSEALPQIRHVYALRNIYFDLYAQYYRSTHFSDITSWGICDALFREIKGEYNFILEMLDLYIKEYKELKLNCLPAVNAINELHELYSYTEKTYNLRTSIPRKMPLDKNKLAESASFVVVRCGMMYSCGFSRIMYRPYYL